MLFSSVMMYHITELELLPPFTFSPAPISQEEMKFGTRWCIRFLPLNRLAQCLLSRLPQKVRDPKTLNICVQSGMLQLVPNTWWSAGKRRGCHVKKAECNHPCEIGRRNVVVSTWLQAVLFCCSLFPDYLGNPLCTLDSGVEEVTSA